VDRSPVDLLLGVALASLVRVTSTHEAKGRDKGEGSSDCKTVGLTVETGRGSRCKRGGCLVPKILSGRKGLLGSLVWLLVLAVLRRSIMRAEGGEEPSAVCNPFQFRLVEQPNLLLCSVSEVLVFHVRADFFRWQGVAAKHDVVFQHEFPVAFVT
jgi:hypothetical protein